jgi:hypothetical protein
MIRWATEERPQTKGEEQHASENLQSKHRLGLLYEFHQIAQGKTCYE